MPVLNYPFEPGFRLVTGSDLNKMIEAINTAFNQTVGSGTIGQPNGVASLDSNGKVPLAQIPALGASPSVTVGLTAKNGAATTYLRSDAAPAIDQTIVPTWTGIHTFNGSTSSTTPSVVLGGNNPEIRFFNSTAPADQKYWRLRTTTSGFNIQTADDASGGSGGGSNPFFSVGRTGVTIDSVFIGPSTNWMTITPTTVTSGGTWTHTGAFTTTGAITAAGSTLIGVVASAANLAQSANVNVPAAYAVPASGTYRVSTYIVMTRAATTSATLPGVFVTYTEATTGVAVADPASLSAVINELGAHSGGSVVIQAQQGTNIGYTTNSYASSGATSMQYDVRVVIERLL